MRARTSSSRPTPSPSPVRTRVRRTAPPSSRTCTRTATRPGAPSPRWRSTRARCAGHLSGMPFRSAARREPGHLLAARIVRGGREPAPAGDRGRAPEAPDRGACARAPGRLRLRLPEPPQPRAALELGPAAVPARARARRASAAPALRRAARRARDASAARSSMRPPPARRSSAVVYGEPGRGGFVRDAAFFRWRFLGPDADLRYRFVALKRRGGGDTMLVALAEHAALGTQFTVLVDGAPDLSAGTPRARAARGAHRRRSPARVPDDQRALARRAAGGARAAALRPAAGRAVPDAGQRGALRRSSPRRPIVTGDWMSFSARIPHQALSEIVADAVQLGVWRPRAPEATLNRSLRSPTEPNAEMGRSCGDCAEAW